MGFISRLFGADAPRAAVQDKGAGKLVTTSQDLAEAMRGGDMSLSGERITPEKALATSAGYACVRLISGAVATMPMPLKRRVDDRTREHASDHPAWSVMMRKPNGWQTPSQFKRMMQAHVLLRGNAYAQIVRSRGQVIALHPINPDRVKPVQNDDLSITYDYLRKDGRKVQFAQSEIFHLMGMTFDGISGVTPLTYARETFGMALAQERFGSEQFRQGLRVGGQLKTDKTLGAAGRENIRASLDEFRAGESRSHSWLILEDGLSAETMSITPADAQWIDSRKFTRSDIAMFYGVPPHMIGDTEKSTSWGSGIEQQSLGFVAYTLEDHLTMWEERAGLSLLSEQESDHYFRYNRASLVRGDIETRFGTYALAMQWGMLSPNEARALEDMNPRKGGDIYYDPPNTAGTPQGGSDAPQQD